MNRLDSRQFWIVTVAGIVATYVMTVTAVWQAGLGLQALDPSGLMIASLNKAHSEPLYGVGFGHLYHYMNGIALGLLYWVLFKSWLPGNWLVKGLLWGAIVFLMAAVIVGPLATGAGIFFSNAPKPGAMLVSSLVAHLAYGVSLTFALAAASPREVATVV